ncbi:Na+/H+ antiporter subunit E [Leucobacter sp. Z1108]|uniref:Na+/H+ antiporter subunit E n=1 Tax=unclassified Leucobacter TaxID=2621730 RepID=UPI003D97C828
MGREARRRERLLKLSELPLLIGLTLTWVALWHEVSLMSVTSGIVVALFAVRLFYLPPVLIAARFNVWWALRYVLYFFWHLAIASVQVAWLTLRPGPPPKTSIVAVRLRTESDFILTMVGLTASLIPGSLIVEVDRYGSTLYLHVLNTPTDRETQHAIQAALDIEELLIRAIGSKRDLRELS